MVAGRESLAAAESQEQVMGVFVLFVIGVYLAGVVATWAVLMCWPWHMSFRETLLIVTLIAIYWPYHLFRLIWR